jgi:hypothetical protein
MKFEASSFVLQASHEYVLLNYSYSAKFDGGGPVLWFPNTCVPDVGGPWCPGGGNVFAPFRFAASPCREEYGDGGRNSRCGSGSRSIYFDDRTQIYRNGTKISATELHPDDHASVETKLDGTAIFAVRIHMVSQEGADEFRGRVASYNAKSGKLTVDTNPAHQMLTVSVPAGTPVVSIGTDRTSTQQMAPVNFVAGSVVDVRLKAGAGGQGVATGIDILAVPGFSFVFHGNLSLLNLHTGKLVIVDPHDHQTYPIDFDPATLPGARELHEGMSVRVTTIFDGVRYVANAVQVQ